MKFLKHICLLGMMVCVTGVWAGTTLPTLSLVTDIPLPGNATRFDYQSYDSNPKILYFSHMGDGELVVFDTQSRKVVTHIPGFPRMTGLIVIPELKKIYASVPGNHEVAVIDTQSLKVITRIPDGQFPDGLAYAREVNKIFVSDESGGKETVIDTLTNQRIDTIDMGGEVGNTQYDSGTHHIFANVQSLNQIVEIDSKTNKIISRHTIKKGKFPHGLYIQADTRLAFIACQDDNKLVVLDLSTFEEKQVFSVGESPDVLAFDTSLNRLYVATESGIVSVFHLNGKTLEKLEDLNVAPNAHTISVDSKTHEVYLPLKNTGAHPFLRIMKATTPSP